MKNGFLKLFALVMAISIGFPAMAADGSVARSMFTSGIKDREPVDELKTLPENVERVYYYTELKGLSGQTIKHRWEHDGQLVAEVPFEVKAARWRVWSSKVLPPDARNGKWSVVVLDGSGNELKRDTLAASSPAVPAGPTAEQPAPAAPAQAPPAR